MNGSVEEVMEPKKIEELLKSHLLEHGLLSDGPQLWTIGYSSLGGRGMFATRDIQPGELIFTDAPLLIGPRCYNKYLPMCVNCYKNECPLFPCDRGCGLPVCSKECEESVQHTQSECQYLRDQSPTCGTMWSMELLLAVTPVRALRFSEEARILVSALQCHQDLYYGYEVNLLQRNIKNPIKAEDINFMERVCGVFNTNAFETVVVKDAGHRTSLRGLYPMGSLQNHCCVPKTRHHFDAKQRLYVTAVLPISAGEEITMIYTDLLWDTTMRRQFLSATKHFLCKCSRCSDVLEFGSRLGALLCASDQCTGNLLPRDPLDLDSSWSCDKCETTINSRQIRSIRSGLSAICQEYLYKSPRQLLRFIQKELSVLVPSTNYVMMDMKFRVVSYFGRTANLTWADLTDGELAIKSVFCQELLSVLDVLGCGDCKKKGLLLYELYCTNVEQAKRHEKYLKVRNRDVSINAEIHAQDNKELLKEALSILQNDVSSTLLQDDTVN